MEFVLCIVFNIDLLLQLRESFEAAVHRDTGHQDDITKNLPL